MKLQEKKVTMLREEEKVFSSDDPNPLRPHNVTARPASPLRAASVVARRSGCPQGFKKPRGEPLLAAATTRRGLPLPPTPCLRGGLCGCAALGVCPRRSFPAFLLSSPSLQLLLRRLPPLPQLPALPPFLAALPIEPGANTSLPTTGAPPFVGPRCSKSGIVLARRNHDAV